MSNEVGGKSKFKYVGEDRRGREARHKEPLSLKLHSLVYVCLLRSGGREPEILPSSCRCIQHPHRGGRERSPRSLERR